MPDAKDVFAGILPNIVKQQFIVGEHWLATKQNGACNDFGKIAKPTLIITATDDNVYVPMVNYFVNAKNIYGSWLVQIYDASNALMDQYSNEISKILQTFLSIQIPLQSNQCFSILDMVIQKLIIKKLTFATCITNSWG